MCLVLNGLGVTDSLGKIVSNDFYRATVSRGHVAFVCPDIMEYLRPADERYVAVQNSDRSTSELFVWEKALDSEDQYRYFLGRNDSLVVVESDAKTDRKLLVVKDSYVHVLVPFFVHHYDEIYMVDLRYFRGSLIDYAANVLIM